MLIKIAIVEDDEACSDLLAGYIKRFEKTAEDKFSVDKFSDGDEILERYQPFYDILFLDIHMRRIDGMSAAREIRKLDKNVILIFVTNQAQYAVKGYSVDALDFLLKPVPYFAFAEQLKKSVERIRLRGSSFVLLHTESGVVKMDAGSIYCAESFDHNIIVSAEGGSYRISGTLNELERKLAGYHFFRCGKSYLVNLALVNSVKGNEIAVGGHKVYVSRSRKKEFFKALTDYFGR